MEDKDIIVKRSTINLRPAFNCSSYTIIVYSAGDMVIGMNILVRSVDSESISRDMIGIVYVIYISLR